MNLFKTLISSALITISLACNNSGSADMNQHNPFLSLDYDKVTAYDYETEGFENIIDKNGKLVKGITKQTDLNKQQIESISKVLCDKSTYGGEIAKCFLPRLGIVFYKNNKVLAHISICMECNSLRSSIDITADKGGFSKKGRKKINGFCKELGFTHCVDNLNTMFDK